MAFWLLPTTTNTLLDIQDFLSDMDMDSYSRMKEMFWIEKEK